MRKFWRMIPALAALLSGCTLAPKYERPIAPVSPAWPRESDNDAARNGADIPWNEFSDDPRLERLIELSLVGNRDYRAAALRVEQARAQYRIRASLYPNVNAEALGNRRRTSETVFDQGDRLTPTTTTYEVNLGVAYELDLFGRVRSLKREALEAYFAMDASRRSVQIALISEVAVQYWTTLQLREARGLAEQTLAAVTDSFNLIRRSFEAGVASELDLRASEAQVQTARVNVATYGQLLSQAENALVLLIGQPIPEDLPAGRTLSEQPLLDDMPAGVPSDLLQRRPDIRAAEHELKAAHANIGAARAAFFPRILLTGAAGTASASLSDLFTGPSATWNFSPQITMPIFQGGRNRANLDVARISRQIEVAHYEKSIQVAFREVADALAERAFVGQKLAAQEQLVQAQRQRFVLTEARYREGVDNYVDVLLAQQDFYAAQQNLLQLRAARLMNGVMLYRSLGGGWEKEG